MEHYFLFSLTETWNNLWSLQVLCIAPWKAAICCFPAGFFIPVQDKLSLPALWKGNVENVETKKPMFLGKPTVST